MQYDQNKQGYPNAGNAYPPQYGQPQMGGPTYMVGTPAYVAPTYVTTSAFVVPVYRPFWNNLALTPITGGLRNFLLISGLLYLILGIITIGLEIGIISNSYHYYFTGFWMSILVVGGGIHMLVAACQAQCSLLQLVRVLSFSLMLCIIGAIVAVVEYIGSTQCDGYSSWYFCDPKLATQLKIARMAVIFITTIHTIVNMVHVSNAHRQSVVAAATGNLPR